MRQILLVGSRGVIPSEIPGILLRHGYTAFTASHGAEALEIIENVQLDWCLVDRFVNHVSGLELIGLLQKCQPRPRIIATNSDTSSAYADYSWLDIALDAGADFTISYPFKIDELLAILCKESTGDPDRKTA